jgi:hypothetical protein
MRVTHLKNVSEEDINVQLLNGASVVLPPKAGLKDVDVVNVGNLHGKVTLTEDLTEVTRPVGKTRIDG